MTLALPSAAALGMVARVPTWMLVTSCKAELEISLVTVLDDLAARTVAM